MIEYASDYALKLSALDDGVPTEGKTFEDEEFEKLKAKYDRMPTHVIPVRNNKSLFRNSTDAGEILRLHTFNKVIAWYDPARMIMKVGYLDSRDRKGIQQMWELKGYDRYTKLEFYMM